MTYADFIIRYDPASEPKEVLGERILQHLILYRLKHKFPVVMLIQGDSGHGKSYTAVRIQEILLKLQGMEIRDYLHDINIYLPTQYMEKARALFFDNKRLKKVNLICMHEARDVIKARDWQSLLASTVADTMNQIRAVKPVAFLICTQFIKDITKEMRWSLNFIFDCRRHKSSHSNVNVRIRKTWKNMKDLENPRLEHGKIKGYIVLPNGKYRLFVPDYLVIKKIAPDIGEMFDKEDRESKAGILNKKIDTMIKQMKLEVDDEHVKINSMVDFYSKDYDRLLLVAKKTRGKWKVHDQVCEMHDLSKNELRIFQTKLNDQINKGDFGFTEEDN